METTLPHHSVDIILFPALVLDLKNHVRSAIPDQDVSTTMVYTHVINQGGQGVQSPFDTTLTLNSKCCIHPFNIQYHNI